MKNRPCAFWHTIVRKPARNCTHVVRELFAPAAIVDLAGECVRTRADARPSARSVAARLDAHDFDLRPKPAASCVAIAAAEEPLSSLSEGTAEGIVRARALR